MSLVDADLLARAQHAVDELVPEGVRVEVLDGLLVVSPPPSLMHAELTARVASLFADRAPAGLTVNATGVGVYRDAGGLAEYQVPDVTVYRRPAGSERLLGSDVELVAEVVSPANRRQASYEDAVVARATAYGIPWVLIIDPDVRTIRWWHEGAERSGGPPWAADIDRATVWQT
jgi:Uma2 family endonuclease